MNNYNEEVEAQMRGRQLIDHAVRVEYQEDMVKICYILVGCLGQLKAITNIKVI